MKFGAGIENRILANQKVEPKEKPKKPEKPKSKILADQKITPRKRVKKSRMGTMGSMFKKPKENKRVVKKSSPDKLSAKGEYRRRLMQRGAAAGLGVLAGTGAFKAVEAATDSQGEESLEETLADISRILEGEGELQEFKEIDELGDLGSVERQEELDEDVEGELSAKEESIDFDEENAGDSLVSPEEEQIEIKKETESVDAEVEPEVINGSTDFDEENAEEVLVSPEEEIDAPELDKETARQEKRVRDYENDEEKEITRLEDSIRDDVEHSLEEVRESLGKIRKSKHHVGSELKIEADDLEKAKENSQKMNKPKSQNEFEGEWEQPLDEDFLDINDGTIKGLKEKKSLKKKSKREIREERIREVEEKKRWEKRERTLMKPYYEAYRILKNSELWPNDLLSDDLFSAQELKESWLDHRAVSKRDAVGLMQNRKKSVLDVNTYLNRIKDWEKEQKMREAEEKGEKFNERNLKYNFKISDTLSGEDLEDIMTFIQEVPEYGRAFGRLYMVMLQDPKFGYGKGQKAYRNGDLNEARKQILANYNAGIGRIEKLSEANWPVETKGYWKKIFKYMDELKMTKKLLDSKGLDSSSENAIYVVRELQRVKKPQRKKYLKQLIAKALFSEHV